MPRDAALLHLLYDSEATAGWHVGMVSIIRTFLQRIALPAAPRVLEVGCGNGEVLRMIAHELPDASLNGIDLNDLAVLHAAQINQLQAAAGQRTGIAKANLLCLPFGDHSFDLLLALDSLDQAGVPLNAALHEAQRVLAPGGHLLLRVSAYPWLYSTHDQAFNTGRRYTRPEIEAALHAHGFALRHITHANTLLAPPVVLMRLAERLKLLLPESSSTPHPTDQEGGIYTSAWANTIVRLALQTEATWLRHTDMPFGLSIIATAQKTGT